MALVTIEGTCLSVGHSDCRRLERGEGVELDERASRSIAVALLSSRNEVSGVVVKVGERGGGCRERGSVLLGVTGVLVPDVGRVGSLDSTEIRG